MDCRRHIHFQGRVQGVGFRYKAVYLARMLGLTGWVRNEWDGTVTMEVQGRELLIDEMLRRLNQDRYIEISWIDTRQIPLEEERSFSVR